MLETDEQTLERLLTPTLYRTLLEQARRDHRPVVQQLRWLVQQAALRPLEVK